MRQQRRLFAVAVAVAALAGAAWAVPVLAGSSSEQPGPQGVTGEIGLASNAAPGSQGSVRPASGASERPAKGGPGTGEITAAPRASDGGGSITRASSPGNDARLIP